MLQRFIVKMSQAAAVALFALGASVFVALPAAAHSPLAVDQQGQSCVQMDCQNDQITSQCNFPVQLTHECGENRKSFCSIVSAGIYNSAVESGVTVVGVPFASSVWSRNILRPNDFYPMDITRKGGITPIDSDSKEFIRGYACAIHTDGSVTSAGAEWHNDENGIPRLVCVHTHKDGSKHTAVTQTPAFECPGEFVNNWAAECLEYETKPLEDLDSGTRLTNKCDCPVVVDSCIGGHPCHSDGHRHAVLQPGESDESSPLPGQEIAWAACFQDDEPYTDDNPKSAENNLWTCNDVQTSCSKIETQGDNAVAMQFQAVIQGETAQATEEVKEEEQPAATGPESTEPEDPLASLRGTSPPAGTPTENALLKCNAWPGQLSANAIANTEGNETVFHEDWECKWLHTDTHLHMAARTNDSNSALWLIANGAEVNAKNKYGNTPLQSAAANNATETAALLLENGAEVNAKGYWGITPLHQAAWKNATETAALLLENGAEINAKNNYGSTPLHWAAEGNATETAALLLENGADVNAKSEDEETPLDLAIAEKHSEMQSILRAHGGECNKWCR